MFKKRLKDYLVLLSLFIAFTLAFYSNSLNFGSNVENLHEKTIDLYDLRISGLQINIITPENITYTQPMNGYYPATYGFENDKIGDLPEDWNELGPVSSDSVEIIAELDGHKRVVDIYKGDTYGTDHHLDQNFVENQEFGEIEFWTRASSLTAAIAIMNSTDPIISINLQGASELAPDVFGYHDNLGWHDTNKTANPNQWYHIRVQFECGAGNHYNLAQYKWRFFVDDEHFGDFSFINNKTSVNIFRIHQNWRYSFFHHYIDAIGYSWDPNYNIGDNYYEGLLVSFENSTTLDWMGYSLDGQTNRTILGNTTFPFLSEGLHTIQVFGNDSVGTMYQSDIRYFSIDVNAPTSMISFIPYIDPDIVIGSTVFTITADDGLGSGVSLIRYKINDSSWNDYTGPFSLSGYEYGIYNISYYAIDVVGHVESVNSILIALIPEPLEPGISGYHLFVIIGIISIVLVIIIKKRFKLKF
ncbi:MAG: OmpL47-type beta-barrel domain-containing protein [Promethearchaeota archaeon]